MTQWWYNHKTGTVEEGPQSLGSDRDGPYDRREDAARAPEIAQERARAWAQEDAAEGDDD
ncbi:MAG: methionine aminopeptidase [Pseudolysinimonas sp.]